jgi:decaprenylphospho-beta-D-ribofuranose 2-oxidase
MTAMAATDTAGPRARLPWAPARLTGWGGGPAAPVELSRPASLGELQATIASATAPGAIPRGMGRSYGDAAQLTTGLVLETTALGGFSLDGATGTVTVGAGVTLGELLHSLVPAGWTLPVLPGTQHVSVGGAIASDIHGKSHGVDGTFGRHVRGLGLLTAAGELLELEPDSDLFGATLGGMGLTGVIVWARIALAPVTSALLSVDTDRADSLDDVLLALRAPGGRYRVAWLDLLGPRPGRGVVTRAEHAPDGTRHGATVRSRARIPARWPGGLLRPNTVRAFNALRFHRAARRGRGQTEPLGAHMFPLDALECWPRLYGPGGFVQYQFVVPLGAERVLEQAIETLRGERVPCYLAVLKDFGPANAAPLSFPIEGWTLALDLPRRAPGLNRALDRLDDLVAEAGGRVYLTKDARLRGEHLDVMYPRLAEWQAVREAVDPAGLWRSDLALRTGLVRP